MQALERTLHFTGNEKIPVPNSVYSLSSVRHFGIHQDEKCHVNLKDHVIIIRELSWHESAVVEVGRLGFYS